MTSVTVLIPTLNEEENVDLLLQRIFRMRRSCNLEFDVLFVDSASSDATCDMVAAWQSREPVRLLRREVNVGLAAAVIAGAQYLDSTFVVVMDADLSHPADTIPDLLRPLYDGTNDMVIGSRYIEGGSTPDWPYSRKLSSKIATFPARFFCDVKDPLAGFFAVERKRLTDLPRAVPGFKIALAILAEYRKDLRVTEIPIEFRDRDYGESKMNRMVAFDYLRQLIGLAVRRLTKSG